ncbi:hypothetical protein [Alkaliphilus serpentinus]|uniref:Uncharacterized protein n=1 Tax=Alkaliphilus serpentinus TaxID=1482731 RepID=A0A833HMJ7_9FIRM|nr:hypothetical protein [Alkaliphilus serpentinus]KAB3527619.1 hypothetical protein F8153_11590 [Alkaliphilus serpentinus]
MKTNKELFLNTIHGLFFGIVLGITLSIISIDIYPEVEKFLNSNWILPALSLVGALIGFIKGYSYKARYLNFLFSTAGTILTPILLSAIMIYFIGIDRFIVLPPIVFKTAIGLQDLDTQIATYIFSIVFTMIFIAAVVSSLTINKRKRWTW